MANFRYLLSIKFVLLLNRPELASFLVGKKEINSTHTSYSHFYELVKVKESCKTIYDSQKPVIKTWFSSTFLKIIETSSNFD